MRFLFITVVAICILTSCQNKKMLHKNKIAILEVLKKQELAWNVGDIEAFMKGYWKSDSLTFIGRTGIKYGWENTLNNYKKSYPTADIMGKLTFEIQKLEMISDNKAFIIGKFTLNRKNDQPSGYFTLLWRKIDGQWYIISDHTSG